MTCRSSNAHLLASLLSFFFPLAVAILEEMQKGHHNHRNWVSLLLRWNVPRCEGLKDSLLLICRSNGSLDICGNLTHSFCDTQFLHYAPHLSGCVKCCHCMSSVKHPPLQKWERRWEILPLQTCILFRSNIKLECGKLNRQLTVFHCSTAFSYKDFFFFFIPAEALDLGQDPWEDKTVTHPLFFHLFAWWCVSLLSGLVGHCWGRDKNQSLILC